MLLALVLSSALAQETGFILRPELQVDLASDRAGEDTVETRTWFRAFARGDLKDDGRWFLEVWGEHQLLAGDDVEGWWDVRPGESGWEGPAGPFRIRAGHLVERWGQLDLLPVVDVINPRDMRNGALTPSDHVRMPIPMVTLEAGSDVVRATTVLIPFAGVDRIEQRGTDWSVVRQRMLNDFGRTAARWPDGAAPALETQVKNLGNSLENQDTFLRRGFNVATAQKGMPEALVYTGEIAERIDISGNGFDLGFMGGYFRSNQSMANLGSYFVDVLKNEQLPLATDTDELYAATEDLLTNEWPYTGMAGLDGSTMLGPIGLRWEAAYLSHRVVRSKYFTSSTTPSVSAGLGLDYVSGTSVFLALEGRIEQMLEPPRTLVLMKRQQATLATTGRFTVARDKVRLAYVAAYDLSFGDYMVRPTVTWRPTDPLELTLGAMLLGGPVEAPDGLMDAVTYSGGPGSYFGQNDAVTFAVGWIR
ncbi:MAG: hypothetical protein ACI8PZ_001918 [Myxococcota bacterium]